jgi:hypothetical protein
MREIKCLLSADCAGMMEWIKPDYGVGTAEVYRHFAVGATKKFENLDLLTVPKVLSNNSLPSCVPDWSVWIQRQPCAFGPFLTEHRLISTQPWTPNIIPGSRPILNYLPLKEK